MKVEILETRLRSRDPVTGRHYDLEAGDRVTVSDTCGAAWCARGWARDLAGEVPTGERVVRGAVVRPKTAAHAAKNMNRKGD